MTHVNGNADKRKMGTLRVSHTTIQLCLLLLPIWLFGGGELARFVRNNAVPGIFERDGLLKGGDFVQFYVAGALAREGRWEELYDVNALEKAVAEMVPAAAGQIPAPVYGPQVALFFSPLSRLDYVSARWWWLAVSAAAYIASAALAVHVAAPFARYAVVAWITVLCNPAFAMLLGTGQTAAFAALWWALAAVMFSLRRPWLIGLCLGLLAYKPPLIAGAIPVLMVLQAWTVLVGMAISVLFQVAISVLLAGTGAWSGYVASLSRIPEYFFLTDTVPHQKQSIAGFYQLLVGPGRTAAVLTVASAVAVLALWWQRRHQRSSALRLPMLAVTAVLLSPHLYVYDLAVLTPALLIVASVLSHIDVSMPRHKAVALTGCAVLLAPIFGALAARTRLQLSTVAIVSFLISVYTLLPELCDQKPHDRPPTSK